MKTKKGQKVFNEIVDAFASEGHYIPETHPGISYKGCLFNVADVNAAIKTKITK